MFTTASFNNTLIIYVTRTSKCRRCVSDPSKIMHFGGSDTGTATFLDSPSNIANNARKELQQHVEKSRDTIRVILSHDELLGIEA